jgi:WXG100 family type VII secretion target
MRESGVTFGVSQTKAEAAEMESTAAKFEQVNDSLQSMLKSLMSELEVLSTAWVGRGGRSFTQVKQQWAQDQQAIQEALTQTAVAIRSSGASYDATDTDASNRMAASNGGLQLPL